MSPACCCGGGSRGHKYRDSAGYSDNKEIVVNENAGDLYHIF